MTRTTNPESPIPNPDLLAQIADLELVARIVVEGLVSGMHRSPFHGYSAEFSQYRHYRPGDDLKYVDWKLAARTDRVYTKQFRETTNMAAAIVVDTSASMGFPIDSPLSKLRYAVIAAAALAHLIATQGDAIGLMAARALRPLESLRVAPSKVEGRQAQGERAPLYLAPRTGRQHLRAVLAALSSLEARGEWHAAETIRRAAERLNRRGLMLVLSDFYDDEEQTFAQLRRAARMGHEIVLFQIMSRDELELPYRRDLEFTDLETGQRLAINAGLARRDYKDAVAAFLERTRMRAGAEGFQYSLIVTDTPPDRALRNFLLSRHT